MKNYYDILGLDLDASKEDIKKAYKTLAFRYHPDKNADSNISDFFTDINEAQQVLLNDWKRNEYDMLLLEEKSDSKIAAIIDTIVSTIKSIKLPVPKYSTGTPKLLVISAVVILVIAAIFFVTKRGDHPLSSKYRAATNGRNQMQQKSAQGEVAAANIAVEKSKIEESKVAPSTPATNNDNKPLISEITTETIASGYTLPPATSSNRNSAPGKNETDNFEPKKNKELNKAKLVASGVLPTSPSKAPVVTSRIIAARVERDKELSNEELLAIVNRATTVISSAGIRSKCVQVRKAKNSNVANAFKVAELLRQKGFVLGGRETLNTNSDGVAIETNGNCINVTIGKML